MIIHCKGLAGQMGASTRRRRLSGGVCRCGCRWCCCCRCCRGCCCCCCRRGGRGCKSVLAARLHFVSIPAGPLRAISRGRHGLGALRFARSITDGGASRRSEPVARMWKDDVLVCPNGGGGQRARPTSTAPPGDTLAHTHNEEDTIGQTAAAAGHRQPLAK
jgi:hypothetical protein